MADVLLPRLNIKVGTKAQYDANKASLDASNTLVLTPISDMFTSNTANDGKGHFAVNGVQINTLAGTVGSNLHVTGGAGTMKPVYLNNGTISAATTYIGYSGTNGGGTAGTAQPIYMDNGVLKHIAENVGSNDATNGYYPIYMYGGTLKKMSYAVPYDQLVSSSTYYPIYMANDTTAGSIDKINFAAQATYSFNPSTKKWKYTTTDGTGLDFGLTKVATW